MPHLLVAGITGSDKSVSLNSMIMSILYKAKPNEVKMLMIDQKLLGLSIYEGIPHLISPVITNQKEATEALKKMVMEMDRRYRHIADSGARNIETFNVSADESSWLPYIIINYTAWNRQDVSRYAQTAGLRRYLQARTRGLLIFKLMEGIVMGTNFHPDDVEDSWSWERRKIKVIGVGRAGGNALNTMIEANLKEVEFLAVNTDLQVLEKSQAHIKLQVGANITRGLGAGSDPQIGKEAALEDVDRIRDTLTGTDMVFITAGMGGGTGTGVAPVIAEIAREMGILTVAVVTKPFLYEGKKRSQNALGGIKELKKFVDTYIVVPNDRIQHVVEKDTSLLKSFAIINDVLKNTVQSITDLILISGLINLDFADVKSIMKNSGKAVMGLGIGSGDDGVIKAAKKAISIPLFEDNTIDGARGILVNITGGESLSLDAVQNATGLIYDSAHNDANIIFGISMNPEMNNDVRVTVVATSFEEV